MQNVYDKVIKYMESSGKVLEQKAGDIKDIGVKKRFLTEEDIRIERGFEKIIKEFDSKHALFAEEENDKYLNADDVWVVDPISGTHLFIENSPHYAIVAAHLHKGKVQFAAVYDPSSDDMYIAFIGKGAFLNGKKISAAKICNKIIFAPSYGWKDRKQVDAMKASLATYDVSESQGSFAINYCLVAKGDYSGLVSFTKDAFPEYAGCFIANEAGKIATNYRGKKDINPEDRVFISGDRDTYKKLLSLTREILK